MSAVDPNELDAVNNAPVAALESNSAPEARLNEPFASWVEPSASSTEPFANWPAPSATATEPSASFIDPSAN